MQKNMNTTCDCKCRKISNQLFNSIVSGDNFMACCTTENKREKMWTIVNSWNTWQCDILFVKIVQYQNSSMFFFVFRTQKKHALFSRARWTLKRLLPSFSVNSFEPVWVRVRLISYAKHEETTMRIDVHQEKPLIEALFWLILSDTDWECQ